MTDLKKSAATETAWAKALYEALRRYEPTPLYDEVCREFGRPTLVAVAS